MFFGGLWHGAAWNFVIWGVLHGLWLGLERLLGALVNGRIKLASVVGWLITFHVVCVGWVFFRSADFSAAMDMFAVMFNGSADVNGLTWFTLALVFGTLAFQFVRPDLHADIGAYFKAKSFAWFGIVFIATLLIIVWVSPPGTAPFIYFQF